MIIHGWWVWLDLFFFFLSLVAGSVISLKPLYVKFVGVVFRYYGSFRPLKSSWWLNAILFMWILLFIVDVSSNLSLPSTLFLILSCFIISLINRWGSAVFILDLANTDLFLECAVSDGLSCVNLNLLDVWFLVLANDGTMNASVLVVRSIWSIPSSSWRPLNTLYFCTTASTSSLFSRYSFWKSMFPFNLFLLHLASKMAFKI